MIKKTAKAAGIILLALILIVMVRTMQFKSKQLIVEAASPIPLGNECEQHLSQAVKIKTISYDDASKFDSAGFMSLITFLERTYPLADSILNKKIINHLSLLYKWEGKNPSLKPAIFMGHMDVVPAEDHGDKKWDFEPFSGEIKDGTIFGRGTMDDKVNVIAILEAVEHLLKAGFKPERTIYLAFGHDEEIGGQNGAKKIAEYLKSQHVKADFVIDEGMVITKSIVPGIEKPVALIGIAEKGYLSLELTVNADGGHSSMPPEETAIGILAAAVSKIEANQMPAKFSEPVNYFLDYVGPEMPFFQKMAFANRWLFKSTIISKYEKSNSGNASVRTTTAPTIFNSGVKDNVLPATAKAVVNFRILPGETHDDVIAHVQQTVKDERIQIKKYGHNNEASPISSVTSESFLNIRKSVQQTFENTITTPALVIAATDAKHYIDVADNAYRFVPLVCEQEDLKRIHGVNEKITVDNFRNCIRFYHQLILNINP